MKKITMYIGEKVFYSQNGNPILPVEMLDTPLVREVLKKLSEYEDIELTPDVIKYKLKENEEVKEQYRMFESGNKQVLEEMHYLVDRIVKLTDLLEHAAEDMKSCYGMDTELTDKIKTLLSND